MALKKLKQNHIIFCDKILQGEDKTKAITEAGFSKTGARSTAHRLLKDPLVIEYLEKNNITEEIKEKSKPLNKLDSLVSFKKGNKHAEDWDEMTAIQLGNDLLEWLKTGGIQNVFYDEFIVLERNLHPNITSYLSSKFDRFKDLLEKCKKIQEIKLVKYGVLDKTNASVTKFVLTNNHGYSEKAETKSENSTTITWNEEKTYE